ncbi:hypothetical protein BRADI_4g06139v3 [Brachypodium distachyon]|uniref:Uncharacterized protein n=1 Tax=Brachypodium distachyon TaxID=15368 RepID=A0A2K2CKS7_BRADI|nr:hypothetical protein BRADI_4g06139v3 [Brachypodium distachyon]
MDFEPPSFDLDIYSVPSFAASGDCSKKTSPQDLMAPGSPAATKLSMKGNMVDLIMRTEDVDCAESKFAPSPWSEGYIHPKPDGDIMVSLMEWCADAPPQYLKMPWVTNEFPRYISMPGSAKQNQLIRDDVLTSNCATFL